MTVKAFTRKNDINKETSYLSKDPEINYGCSAKISSTAVFNNNHIYQIAN